ncbi:thioesterase superfamily protein [Mycolicibacterium canariasense]|uniref:Acyl-coenzyme A thioesterase THEM4 n=1 Tax=Mycolicibacterium canariasense TaxID=228230 RepID=A0A117IA76_MYCCR|nr:PaaI family thioesterase [Mycolicibacterium canariasense]MCV7210463.1 PaaI family thioesterase [Mycolicibacterium canariasense]ORU97047.1 thioesterase [Mycolicibacterium canariasense]GAS95899.1 thioesterase superfamily protein [Mycolicibacterium canariasense]
MLDFTLEDLSAEDVERLRTVYRPLTESVRELIDATIRSEADADAVAAARAHIDAATAILQRQQLDGPFGVRFTAEGDRMPWGNAVIGLRNPIAPPLAVQRNADGSVFADFVLGAAYEGPPGHVHGGVAALLLDHVLGESASPATSPRLTGTISVRYLRPTPLGALHIEAAIVRTEGVKTFAAGLIADADGPTVQAEGVFIRPKWARG